MKAIYSNVYKSYLIRYLIVSENSNLLSHIKNIMDNFNDKSVTVKWIDPKIKK